MPVPLIVINFGHSVLRSLDDYTQAASEIYRHYRMGQNVVAVTSAQGDQTDVLMAEARRVGPGDDAKNLAELISLGEKRSAALLSLALERIGAPAYVRQARDLGLRADGTGVNARLIDLDVPQLERDLKVHDIVVMPGFVAIGDNDRPALLGQGGADLTALYVAHKLGARALLLKDVPGVFDRDPKDAGQAALRYDAISWDEAKSRARVLIAPRALAFAAKNKFEFDLGMPGIPFHTRVGETSSAALPAPKPRRLRVAMLGCGVVGGGVMRRIEANAARFELVKIMVRDVKKYTDQGVPADILTTEFEALLAAKPDIYIDVSGGVEPALTRMNAMIDAGVHVVSANKQALAGGGFALDHFATEKGVTLACSGAAGGGMPIIEMCKREAGRMVRVEALLNGTTNFMLGKISAGASYAEALREAQDLGFAEADPSDDVNGADAAAKIRLIARFGFGREIALADIPRTTIEGFDGSGFDHIAKRAGIITDQDGVFSARLELLDLPEEHFIAQAQGEEAHATFTFTNGETYRIRGKGAGRWPTAEAVMADLFDISQDIAF